MSDELPIVKRLRKQIKAVQNTTMPPECAPEIDAEDVEELLASFTELVAALEPFAAALKDNYHHQADDLPIIAGSNQMDLRFKWTLGQFRAAQAVLNKVRGE